LSNQDSMDKQYLNLSVLTHAGDL